MTRLYTSLAEIKSFDPCSSGWKNILKGQGNTEEQFLLVDCLKSNTISDVCWLLGKRKKEIQIVVKFAKMCADSVKHIRCGAASDASAYATAAIAAADAASDASAYADAAIAAADAADAASDAFYDADAAADAAAAAYAAAAAINAAAAAADAAAYAAASAYARCKQIELNRSFLIQCIENFELELDK